MNTLSGSSIVFIPMETACSSSKRSTDTSVILSGGSMATATKQIPIHDFVIALRKFPEATFGPTEQIRKFLEDNPLNPDSLAPYLTWDRQHYTRNLIDKNPLYELIAVCWEIGQASSIHNHRDQNCWMAVPIGRLLVENYHVVQQDIAAGKCTIESTEIVEMN